MADGGLMEIFLKKIGIVKESRIALDGLTVITGKNNSGKTTVGKTLYSLIDAVSNLERKVASDRRYYIYKQLSEIEPVLDMLRIYFRGRRRDNDPALSETALYNFFDRRYIHDRQGFTSIDFEDFAHQLYTELKSFDYQKISLSDIEPYFKRSLRSRYEDKYSASEILQRQIDEAIHILEGIFANLDKDPDFVEYAKESIAQTLHVEFSGQIQPVREPEASSEIRISDIESCFFDIKIKQNKIISPKDEKVYFASPCKRAYLIDDPFVVDRMSGIPYRSFRVSDYSEINTVFNSGRIETHNERLQRILHYNSGNTVLEKTIIEDALSIIRARIDTILPGTIELSEEGDYYIQNGMKLEISNLATGSKLFTIVKMLLEKGELDRSTMLILDEPESHLHPQWQNAFAEIIVLLAKELGEKILLTTHSPNFMLAIDANMRKYSFADKTNFYQTYVLSDGFVEYRCVNDNIEDIYSDFLQYLSEAKYLRDSYMFGTGTGEE